MSLTLYFLRHGETTFSQSGSYCGFIDPDLTAEGDRMAQEFAFSYQKIPLQAIYVSPMKRTIATAQPLCDLVGIDMQLRNGLKELNYGAWEGKTPEYVKENYLDDYIKWMNEPAWNSPTKGERAIEVANRAVSIISEIESTYTEGNVLVVSHKGTIRVMLCSLLGIDLGCYRNRIDMPVAAISVVKFGVHGPMLQKLGDRSHLSEELRDRIGT